MRVHVAERFAGICSCAYAAHVVRQSVRGKIYTYLDSCSWSTADFSIGDATSDLSNRMNVILTRGESRCINNCDYERNEIYDNYMERTGWIFIL